jgi:hypothetical protein
MNQVNRKNRNDVLFIAVLLLIVTLAGAAFFFLRGEGDSVTVSVDGKHYGTYPLRTALTLSIRTGEGDTQENLLVIRDGHAYVESATCPDGICAAHKPISREGESIVCLPHRVVITVHTTDGEEPDIIA